MHTFMWSKLFLIHSIIVLCSSLCKCQWDYIMSFSIGAYKLMRIKLSLWYSSSCSLYSSSCSVYSSSCSLLSLSWLLSSNNGKRGRGGGGRGWGKEGVQLSLHGGEHFDDFHLKPRFCNVNLLHASKVPRPNASQNMKPHLSLVTKCNTEVLLTSRLRTTLTTHREGGA